MTTRSYIGESKKAALFFLSAITLAMAISLSPVQYATAQESLDETFTLNLKNVDIHSLIETVSIRTGKNFIVDPRVKATITIASQEPVNADKLYEMFLSVLEVHGYVAVKAGSLVKIIPASVGAQSAVPLLDKQPDAGDWLISRLIHLENTPALQIVETLRPLLPESASLSAESTSNTIVVTDSAANIEKVIKLITLLDDR